MMSHVIKVLGQFHVLDNPRPQKTEQIQMTVFFYHILYQYHKISMSSICLITNLFISENIYILCWTDPKKIIVLLAFSYFLTYSDLVLLPGFPLTTVVRVGIYPAPFLQEIWNYDVGTDPTIVLIL